MQVECSEPEGTVVRSLKLCELTVEKLAFFWEKLKDFDVLFNDFVRGDFPAFLEHFVLQVNGEPVPAGLIWEVDDVGLFLLNEIIPGVSGMGHFVFWDRRFTGRENLCRQMARYALETYDLQKISVAVPVYAYFTLRAMELIGFVREGRLRREALYKGKWFDVNRYSILRDEDFLIHEGRKKHLHQVCFNCGNVYLGAKNGTERKDS